MGDNQVRAGTVRWTSIGARGRHDRRDSADASCSTIGSIHYEYTKRFFDLLLSSLLLMASVPLLMLLAVCIWADSGRPVWISQTRVGRWGRLFRLWKLRTLPTEALADSDRAWAVEPQSRLTAVIRRSGLDELPQLVNVVRGEMSLVGPRPERPHFVDQFDARFPDYGLRLQLRPGVTGLAQVSDCRGDTSIARRLEHDLNYRAGWNLALDLRILRRTAKIVVSSLKPPYGLQ